MYKFTAYDFEIVRTPVAKDDPCINFEWVKEQKMRLDAALVVALSLETDDPKVLEKLHNKRDEWRKQNLAYAVQIEQDGKVRRLQYMRAQPDTPRPEYDREKPWADYQWQKAWSKKRSWHEVETFHTDYPTAHFAIMGRDY